jgi:hypothetical protein
LIWAEVAQAEIIDWWDETRSHVAHRCRTTEAELAALVNERSSGLGTADILNPVSRARKEIQSEVEARVRGFEKSLTRELEMSLQSSFEDVENSENFGGVDWAGAGFLAASGATAVGAVGLAVGATGLATVGMPAYVFFSTTAFSWPIFAAVAVCGATLATFSVTTRRKGHELMLSRYRRQMLKHIHSTLSSMNAKDAKRSCRAQLCAQLDKVRDARLEAFEK